MRNKNRTAAIDWILQRDLDFTKRLGTSHNSYFQKRLYRAQSTKDNATVWNGIDRHLYHKAFKKQGKRVERVCVEWQALPLPHCHQLVDNVINLFFITFLHNRQCLQINNIQESKDLTKFF